MSLNKKRELRLIAKVICRELRKNQTEVESILWECIRNRKWLRTKFYRQYPIFFDYLGKETFFVADFYTHSSKLAIEIDGKIHNYQKENDRLRDQLINLKGIEVLRINNIEIEQNLEKVIDTIKVNLRTKHRERKSWIIYILAKSYFIFYSPSLFKRRGRGMSLIIPNTHPA